MVCLDVQVGDNGHFLRYGKVAIRVSVSGLHTDRQNLMRVWTGERGSALCTDLVQAHGLAQFCTVSSQRFLSVEIWYRKVTEYVFSTGWSPICLGLICLQK